MKTKERRPRPFGVGDLRVQPVRRRAQDPAGVWYWRALRYVDGAAQYVWTGWGTRAEVTRAVSGLVASGEAETGKSHAGRLSVRDLLELHIGALEVRQELGGLAERTVKTRRNAARRLVADPLGRADLLTLHQDQVDAYAARRLRAGGAPATVHLDLRELREALRWGEERDLVSRVRVKMPALNLSRRTREAYTPTREEVIAILDQLEGWPWLAVRILVGVGARVGEVAQLTWADVLLEEGPRGAIRLEGAGRVGSEQRTGKKAARWVPLPPDLAFILAARSRSEPLFPVAPSTIIAKLREHLRRACDVLSLPRWSPQGGRRYTSEELLSPQTALRHYAAGRDSRLADLAGALTLDQHKATSTTSLPDAENPGRNDVSTGVGGTPNGSGHRSSSPLLSDSMPGPGGPVISPDQHNQHSQRRRHGRE